MSEFNRRTILKRAGQTTIGGSALGVLSGTVTADPFDGHYVNTRCYYNCEPDTWYQPRWWDCDYALPYGADDLTVVIHGFQNDHSGAISAAKTASRYLDSSGYTGRMMAWSWKSDCGDCGWGCWDDYDVAATIAKWEGRRLANFIDWWYDNYPSSNLRLLSHSQGARVLIYALYYLSDEQNHFTWDDNMAVTSAHILAGAEDNRQVEWKDVYIQSNTAGTYNYMNPEDDTLWWFEQHWGAESLGREGGEVVDEPCNFWDRNFGAWNDHDLESYLQVYADQVVDDMADVAYDRSRSC